jgi:hypothetical protein
MKNPFSSHRFCDSLQTAFWHAQHEDETSINSEFQQYIVQIAPPLRYSRGLGHRTRPRAPPTWLPQTLTTPREAGPVSFRSSFCSRNRLLRKRIGDWTESWKIPTLAQSAMGGTWGKAPGGLNVRLTLIAGAMALLGLGAVPVYAMDVPALPDAGSNVTLVAGGCGVGFHRGPHGGCRPNGGGAYHYHGGRHCWWRNGVRVCN